MLFLFLFILLLFACFIFLFYCFFFSFSFFRDNNMISISTVEFRYYVVLITLVNLGKPLTIGIKTVDKISFQWTSESEAGLWISELDFHCQVFPFCTYNYTLLNLALKTILLIFITTQKMWCCEYWYWFGWYNLWCVKWGSLNYPFLR